MTSLTMVFTEEDHVVIKFLHQIKGYSSTFGKRISVEKKENWRFEQTSEVN